MEAGERTKVPLNVNFAIFFFFFFFSLSLISLRKYLREKWRNVMLRRHPTPFKLQLVYVSQTVYFNAVSIHQYGGLKIEVET